MLFSDGHFLSLSVYGEGLRKREGTRQGNCSVCKQEMVSGGEKERESEREPERESEPLASSKCFFAVSGFVMFAM